MKALRATRELARVAGNTQGDWWVLDVQDRGKASCYRYRVTGECHGHGPEYVQNCEFIWEVRDIDDERYIAHPDAGDSVLAKMNDARAITVQS